MASLAYILSVLALLALVESAPRAKRQVYQQQYPQQQQYPGQQQQYPGQQQQYPVQQPGNFNCPQPNGQFAYTGDCSRFYQCDNSVATVANCQPQLVFNPGAGYCDWPHNVPNCPPPANQQLIKAEIGNLCASNPAGGQPLQPFHVAHHRYCNAFFTCSTGYMFGQCTFCPNGTYFNRLAGACRGFPSGIIDTNPICEGKTMIDDTRKAALTLGDDCWPFANLVNPWAALAQTLAGANPVYNTPGNNPPVYTPPVYTPPVYNPPVYNPTYPYNNNNNNNNNPYNG